MTSSCPAPVRYPSSSTQAVIAAIDAAVAELDRTLRVHRAALERVRIGFHGSVRRRLDDEVALRSGLLSLWTQQLVYQRDELVAELGEARVLVDARTAAVAKCLAGDGD
ncbi:MAG: hypothetical protein KDB21_11160 [Acidimicrobiales bacterium]|nr:hypothetical protein [Acidimicrobiales bacterium]